MRGVVTVINQKWDSLVDVLIDSILTFSQEYIFVGTVGFNKSFDNPRVICKKISDNDTFSEICKCKHLAVLNSGFEQGIFLDGDCIVGPDFLSFFENGIQQCALPYPLCSRHPYAPDVNYTAHFRENIGEYLSAKLLHEPIMPYVHANYFFHEKMFPFLEELITILNKDEYVAPFHDESALNFLLAEKQATEQLSFTFTNFYPGKIDRYIDGLPVNNGVFNKEQYTTASGAVFHGEKNARDAFKNLKKLKRFVNTNCKFNFDDLNILLLNNQGNEISSKLYSNLDSYTIRAHNRSATPTNLYHELKAFNAPILLLNAKATLTQVIDLYSMSIPENCEILLFGMSKYDIQLQHYNDFFVKVLSCHGTFAALFITQNQLNNYREYLLHQSSEFIDEFFWNNTHHTCYGLMQPSIFMPHESEWTLYKIDEIKNKLQQN